MKSKKECIVSVLLIPLQFATKQNIKEELLAGIVTASAFSSYVVWFLNEAKPMMPDNYLAYECAHQNQIKIIVQKSFECNLNTNIIAY